TRDITRGRGGSSGRERSPSRRKGDSSSANGGQVTQRPGWSSLATSVRELTIGSQAIVGLLWPCFCFWGRIGGLALPVSMTAGTTQAEDQEFSAVKIT